MKRIIAIILAGLMLFAFAECGEDEQQTEQKSGQKTEQKAEKKDRSSFMMTCAKAALKHKYVGERLDYDSDEYWYQTGQEYDENKIDVFYCLSTTLVSAKDEDGNQSLFSTLSDEDREIMKDEYEYMPTEVFDSEHFNFIAPYYRQMTFEAYSETDRKAVLPAMGSAVTDPCDAFDYYMRNINNGKPFIIAGFSQGGMMTQVLLIHMNDRQYERMIAAYSMGFQVTEAELKEPHFKVAEGEDDLGALISYNSVSSTDTMWDQIEGDSAACINPLNWKTDDTPATIECRAAN